ncbi:MAG: hypothetical protein ACOYZ7_01420 [Chloroflexota bacterium]
MAFANRLYWLLMWPLNWILDRLAHLDDHSQSMPTLPPHIGQALKVSDRI